MSGEMNAPVILALKPGSVSARDRRRLAKAGIVVIEHERPEEVRPVRVGVMMPDAGTMLSCALDAMAEGGYENTIRERFVKDLAASMKASS